MLTRSFFAGSPRWGPMWTGDNAATWGALKVSVPMLLSSSLAGYPWAGDHRPTLLPGLFVTLAHGLSPNVHRFPPNPAVLHCIALLSCASALQNSCQVLTMIQDIQTLLP